jgi:hypothetical protein
MMPDQELTCAMRNYHYVADNELRTRLIMNKNLKVLLSAIAVAALVATPAVAKSHTQLHYAGPDLAHRSGADIRDYVTGQRLSTDPDPRIRSELRRDGSSSWEAD